MPSNHLILYRPLLLPPSIFPSIRVFSKESVFPLRWPKYWSFSFNISPSNEYSGLISLRMDWLDLLAVQGTLKSLLQHHSSKTSIFQGSAFFIVQLSHPYMTTGKTIAFTRRTFVDKVMPLLFNMLSRLVITFLPISIQFHLWGSSPLWLTEIYLLTYVSGLLFFIHYFFLNWDILDLQCCATFSCIAKWLSYAHMYILFYILFHYSLSREIGCSSLWAFESCFLYLFFLTWWAVLGFSTKMLLLLDVVELLGMVILHKLLFIILGVF